LHTYTITAKSEKGADLGTGTYKVTYSDKSCTKSATTPVKFTVSTIAKVMYLEGAEDTAVTWKVPVTTPSQCASQFVYTFVAKGGANDSKFTFTNPVTAGSTSIKFKKDLTLKTEGSELTLNQICGVAVGGIDSRTQNE